MLLDLILIGVSAGLGACLRWGFAIWFNPLYPLIPLGTVIANLLGGFLIGVVIEITKNHAFLTEGMRLALTVGFLGGLTTFSTFSAEVVTMFLRSEYLWAFTTIALHLGGALLLTFAGMFLVKLIWGV